MMYGDARSDGLLFGRFVLLESTGDLYLFSSLFAGDARERAWALAELLTARTELLVAEVLTLCWGEVDWRAGTACIHSCLPWPGRRAPGYMHRVELGAVCVAALSFHFRRCGEPDVEERVIASELGDATA